MILLPRFASAARAQPDDGEARRRRLEAPGARRVERRPDGYARVEVLDRAAALADRVVVVVDARLEASSAARHRHAAGDAELGQQRERAVDGLLRDAR